MKVSLAYLGFEFPYGVISHYLLVSQGHLKWAILTPSTLRPVSLALDLPSLLQVGDHDYGGWPLLPDQPPEINQSLR